MMELQLQNRQVQRLYPQMELSLMVLGLNEIELCEYIEGYVAENPLVEMEYPEHVADAKYLLKKKLDWMNARPERGQVKYAEQDAPSMEETICDDREDASAYLLRQIGETRLEPNLAECAKLVVQYLDEDGFLTNDVIRAARGRFSQKLLEQAIEVVRGLDPPGVGARNLQDSLCLQLKRKGMLTGLRKQIIEDCLFDLCRGKLTRMAGKLGIGEDRLAREYELIKGLNPRPCVSLNTSEQQAFVVPDIIIHCGGSGIEIELNEYIPSITVSSYYQGMLRSTDSMEVVNYIAGQLRHAEWLVSCLEKRRNTIRAVAKSVAERQREFFETGSALKPMKMAEIAQEVGVHESTASRAIRGKYIQSDFGVYELRKLFQTGPREEQDVSADTVRQKIKRIVEGEDKKNPFSDSKITDILKQEGIQVSRRTVAKYREQVGILSSAYRHR